MPPTFRKLATIAMLLVGARLYAIGFWENPWPILIAVAAGFLVPAVPWVDRRVRPVIERLREPSTRFRAGIAAAIAVAAGVCLFCEAYFTGRDLAPRLHDEQMFLVQMHIMASGHLWMPQHEVADAFETFHVFVKPVYAGMHFPGTALMYVPAVWLRLPVWLLPLAVCGAAVGLLYRVTAELADGLVGLLTALLFLRVGQLRTLAPAIMSEPVALLLGLATIWAWLHWRRRASRARAGWAMAIGALAGWAAITRPVEAICFAAPVGLAMLLDIAARKGPAPADEARELTRPQLLMLTVGGLLLGAFPFMTLQLIFDRGVTGQWLRTPHQVYCDQFFPGATFGATMLDPNRRPDTKLPQKLTYYDNFIALAIKEHADAGLIDQWFGGRRLLRLWDVASRPSLPLVFLPVSVLAMGGRRWVLCAMLPIFVLLYSFNSFLLLSYAFMAAPAILFLVALGLYAVAEAWPGRGRYVGNSLAVGMVVGAGLLPHFTERHGADDLMPAEELIAINKELAGVPGRALVLFRYAPNLSPHVEPVYNTDVAWPDDARVIRAHDLGPSEDAKLFRYYAARQPDRTVYLVDRARCQGTADVHAAVRLLGPVSDPHLLEALPGQDGSTQ